MGNHEILLQEKHFWKVFEGGKTEIKPVLTCVYWNSVKNCPTKTY